MNQDFRSGRENLELEHNWQEKNFSTPRVLTTQYNFH
jgi:hypothetical protein